MSAKIPKIVDCSKCKYKCQEYFNEKKREILCKKYWNLNDFNRQKDFILSCLEKEATQCLNRVPKTQRPRSLYQCAACDRYKTASLDNKLQLEESNNEHLDRMHQSFIAKDIDNTLSKITSNYVVASFDLQSTLQIPCSDVSLISEIGSCLLKWIQTLPTEVTNITLYSDSCGGQNRNHNIMALMIYIIQTTNIIQIEHKFMESGHSMMEVDSMHSAIENAKRNVPIYGAQDWLTIFQVARSTRNRNKSKPPYEVKEMQYKDFMNLQKLSSLFLKNKKVDTDGNIMNWLKVKCLEYRKDNPYIVGYKYDYFSEYQFIDVGKKLLGVKLNQPIQNVIPDAFHNFYKSLPSIPFKKDIAPELEESDLEVDED
ncbi:hypothetical protein AGLY_001528 [Aphis glycines]|uniref:DUF7869 domain-containing protein n=1 Tax=Aphis glycines TaxID=307491 RepID=A0A6G0U6V9_APHGL|nr:hypothetical protein AGLY_001528 [Aphis glycines]